MKNGKYLIFTLFFVIIILLGACGKTQNIDPSIPDYKPITAPTGVAGELFNGNNSLVLPNTRGPVGFFIFKFNPNNSGTITIDMKNTFQLNLIDCTSTSGRKASTPVLKWYEYIDGNAQVPILVSIDDSNFHYDFLAGRKFILEIMLPNPKENYGDCKKLEAFLQTSVNH